VPLSHGNLAASLANIALTYELGPGDRSLLVMPLFHVHGLMAGASDFFSGSYLERSARSAVLPSTDVRRMTVWREVCHAGEKIVQSDVMWRQPPALQSQRLAGSAQQGGRACVHKQHADAGLLSCPSGTQAG
jgi:acyl-CoA synthetase (AMP-forming)/AMP-acid ligase II